MQILEKLTLVLLIPLIILSTLEAKNNSNNLTDEQLHTLMSIINNFILMEEPKNFHFVGLSNEITIAENQISALTLSVVDAEGTVIYSISGEDSSSFTISNTGVITFNTAPDFETIDTYTLTVMASDSAGHTAMQDVIIHISNLPESTLKKTGQTKSYDENGTEVLDGSIKDDGYFQVGLIPNYTRNDTTNIVMDQITGLQWQDDNETKTLTKNWTNAQSYCRSLDLDGSGWRLPTIIELQSIVVDGAHNPSIDTTAFVNYNNSGHYWSSTSYANYTAYAWVVLFGNGETYDGSKSTRRYVRCIR